MARLPGAVIVVDYSEVIEPVARPALETAVAVLELLRLHRPAQIYQVAFDAVRVALRQLDLDTRTRGRTTDEEASASDAAAVDTRGP